MGPRDDEDVDVDFPFFHVRVRAGGTRVRFGSGDDEKEVLDMERSESSEYWAVRRRVRKRLRFFRHAFTYVVLVGLFVLLDWRSGGAGSAINWSQWVALIWGIFLGWEFISTFVAPLLWGREMEERLIQRELRRQRGG